MGAKNSTENGSVTMALDDYDNMVTMLRKNASEIEELEQCIEKSSEFVMVGCIGWSTRNYYTMGVNKFIENTIERVKNMSVKEFKEWKKANADK